MLWRAKNKIKDKDENETEKKKHGGKRIRYLEMLNI